MKNDDFTTRLIDRLLSYEPPEPEPQEPAPPPVTTPLKERVAKLLACIPDELKTEGLPLEYIRSRLAGVTRGKNARADAVGRAMRQLGWTRKRYWRQSREGFHSRWFPPAKTND
jgi:hypothetical protein